jgi:LPXTG-motif cell wall-anchored protein
MPTTGAGDSSAWILPLLAIALFAVAGGMLLVRRKAPR